jgi:hypothetical protein
MVPFTWPGGNPVTDVPGLSPILPSIAVRPVFVIVDPASTAKFAAVPSGTGAVAALAPAWIPMSPAMATARAEPRASQRNQGALREPRVRKAIIRTGHSPALSHTQSGGDARLNILS